jgi:ABC-type multidrug transport system fused ATPase/permease subunit
MTDEETRAILRELVSAKREEIELQRRSNELWERHIDEISASNRESMEMNRRNTEKYESQAKAHEKAMTEAAALNRSNKIANIIRALGILFIGVALFYLLMAEIQRH